MFPVLICCCHFFKRKSNPIILVVIFLGFGDIPVGFHFTYFFSHVATPVISNIVGHQICFCQYVVFFFWVKMVMSNEIYGRSGSF